MTNGEIVIKGGVGTSASLGAWYLSHVQQINGTLSTVSLIVGITLGVLSTCKLFFKNRKPENP